MSRKIILYIATSLDGYIAREDGSLDWLPEAEDEDFGYDDFYKTIDTVVMGRTTYEQVITELSPDVWAYEGKKCYVATRKNLTKDERVEFVTDDVADFANNLKRQEGKDIWLVGGGKLVDEFIKQNLIDKYIITIIPTILGNGIPLFLKNNPETKLKLIETKAIGDVVQVEYTR